MPQAPLFFAAFNASWPPLIQLPITWIESPFNPLDSYKLMISCGLTATPAIFSMRLLLIWLPPEFTLSSWAKWANTELFPFKFKHWLLLILITVDKRAYTPKATLVKKQLSTVMFEQLLFKITA